MADKMKNETLKKHAKILGKKMSLGGDDFLKVADEAFNLLDVDGNGTIERGDIEILLNLTGIEEIDDIGLEADTLMKEIDDDGNGQIDRVEWRDKWLSMQKALAKFKPNEDLKLKMEENFGKKEAKDLPLYAYGNKLSFYRLPTYPEENENRPQADCVFFGNPYDAATTYRMGARFGPAAVRKVSQTLAFNYSPYFEKDYSKMRIYDAGDSAGNPFNILTAMNQTYLYAKKLWNSSSRVIGIGGDHSLSWCMLRAARDVTGGPVALVNLDAHFDTVDEYQGGRLTHGTALRRAMDDGCLDMTKAFHVGCRGSVIAEKVLVEDREQGWTTINLDTFVDIGPVEAARRVREQIGDTPTIVSVDMDVLEPGECPGVGFIEAGGMTCRELFRFLRALKGLNVIGGEVCELTPEYDMSSVSAQVAATSAYEIMCLALNNV